MATVPISFRVSPELETALKSAALRSGKDVTAFLRDLVRNAVEEKQEVAEEGASSGLADAVEKLKQVVESQCEQTIVVAHTLAQLKAVVEKSSENHGKQLAQLSKGIEILKVQIGEVDVDGERRKVTEMVAHEVALLRKNLQVALSNLCILARPDLVKEDVVARIREAFEKR